MSRFPGLPSIIGDTDDDASIHLNSKVGPARPLPKMNDKARLINNILNSEPDVVDNSYNSLFTKYFSGITNEPGVEQQVEEPMNDHGPESVIEKEKNGDVELNDDDDLEDIDYEDNQDDIGDDGEDLDFDDDTEVESESEDTDNIKKSVEQAPSVASLDPFKIFLVLFMLQSIVVFFYLNRQRTSTSTPVDNYFEINSKFNIIDKQINELSSKHESSLESLNSLDSQLNKIVENTNKFQESSFQISQELLVKYNSLDSKLSQLSLVTNATEVKENLNDLININKNIETVKEDIIHQLIDILPSHLPIYIKNNKVHYIPEFNKFLYNFVDSYMKENDSKTWQEFLNTHKESLQSYISKIMQESNLKGMGKGEFQKLLQDKFKENNEEIITKFNNLIDNLDINGTEANDKTLRFNGDLIFLNNILEFLSKGSINVNYADYKLGSRILGFLTSAPHDNKSLPRKLLLGWYDYLVESVPQPSDLKYNANNLLIDGGSSWVCNPDNSNICSVGVKLSNPIIMTDLILKSTDLQTIPKFVSIYVKPTSRKSFEDIVAYLNEFKIDFNLPTSSNKYLRKFVKIKEAKLEMTPLNHIKVALSLINLRIPIKDVYIEFHGTNQNEMIEMFNLKVYGISEYNSYKYNKEFETIIDSLKDQFEQVPTRELKIDNYIYDETFNVGILGEE